MKLSFFKKMELLIRSTLFWFFSILEICIFGSFSLLILPLSLHARHRVLRTFLRINTFLLKWFCQVRYEVHGLENLNGLTHGVALCKHQSTYETFLLPQFFLNPAVIVKRELLWIPFFGWGMIASNPISINRSDAKSSMQQVMEKGERYLADRRWVILFPEGTRVAPGTTGQYRLGGARLAEKAGVPVVPVAHNAGYIWRRKGFIKYPGLVTVVIGKPIQAQGKTPEIILEEAKQWIEETCVQIGNGRWK